MAIVVKFFKTVNLLSQFPNYPLGKGLAPHLLFSQGLFVPSLFQTETGVMEKMKTRQVQTTTNTAGHSFIRKTCNRIKTK